MIPSAQLSLIKSDIAIHVFAADIPHKMSKNVCVVYHNLLTQVFFIDFAECFPLRRELTQSQGPISQKHLSECIHLHILYPSTALSTHKF